jgi:hypothetical protein
MVTTLTGSSAVSSISSPEFSLVRASELKHWLSLMHFLTKSENDGFEENF